ncbi:MAG TPA: BON domain-containing protein [Longimicrobiales bacterium]|nr:BON domain-containing protein [Longimicrobiales bacterium]
MFRREPRHLNTLAVSVGAAAAAAAGFAAMAVTRALRRRAARAYPDGTGLEGAAVEVLRRDSDTGSCAIDVAIIAPGILELTGAVPTRQVAHRAADLLHGLPGVSTVISRLQVGALEERLAANRERRASGDPRTLERHWYGVRVGTGRRRQSPATEPDRPDDSLARRTRQLDAGLDDVPGRTGRYGADGGPPL